MGLIMGPNITCRALVLKTADPAQSTYIGNLNKQIWALITYIGPGPKYYRRTGLLYIITRFRERFINRAVTVPLCKQNKV